MDADTLPARERPEEPRSPAPRFARALSRHDHLGDDLNDFIATSGKYVRERNASSRNERKLGHTCSSPERETILESAVTGSTGPRASSCKESNMEK